MESLLRTVVAVMAFVCLAAAASPASAAWVENGVPLCTMAGTQMSQVMIPVEPGVFVVAWMDSNTADIYAQLIDSYGNIHWGENGVAVCTAAYLQISPAIVKDFMGGVIIVWEDSRSGDYDIYAQRLDIDGNALWTAGGIPVCSHSEDQIYSEVVPDGAGGAIITWTDYRYGLSDPDIYVQRIDASGTTWWGTSGYPVCGSLGAQDDPEIVRDGEGGAVIVWEDERAGRAVYAQRMSHDGVAQWAPDGVLVSSITSLYLDLDVVADGTGGAIVVWDENRTSDNDVYAQRIDGDGILIWGPGDREVCTASGNQYVADVVSDGNGGAIVVWNDLGALDTDVYAQRLNRSGIEQWSPGGRLVFGTVNNEYAYGICTDQAGGAILSMASDRNGDRDIYVQRIEESGGYAQWLSTGVPLCDISEDQVASRLFTDGAGGAVVVWVDFRPGNTTDLYAQRVARGGYWGYPCPDLNGFHDVPFDQGGSVLLTWGASRLDALSEDGIEYYSVWRNLGILEMHEPEEAGDGNISSVPVGPDFEGEAYRSISLEGEMFGFEWIGNVEGHLQDTYSYAAATYFDSTSVDPAIHTFMVSAHRSSELYWDSWFIHGWSKDNLSPCPPLALSGEESSVPAGLNISWAPNTEEDLGGYNVYRDTGPSFEPGPGNLLGSICDTLLLDGEWTEESDFCYKVAAVDIHGNESDYALLCPGDATGDDPMPVPDVTFLDQNFPNPFNPNTTIAFGLKTGGFVSLSIYNAAGQLVAQLINDSRPAGQYATVWNGKVQNGSSAASGIYFYRLVTGDFTQTRKMVLLR